ncbi:hypothetical protein PMI10_03282 [Flavobacterium sp. CF136]|nr:hypothetical protein PMI10_03282 [Flavobacterium sp. CF136]
MLESFFSYKFGYKLVITEFTYKLKRDRPVLSCFILLAINTIINISYPQRVITYKIFF